MTIRADARFVGFGGCVGAGLILIGLVAVPTSLALGYLPMTALGGMFLISGVGCSLALRRCDLSLTSDAVVYRIGWSTYRWARSEVADIQCDSRYAPWGVERLVISRLDGTELLAAVCWFDPADVRAIRSALRENDGR